MRMGWTARALGCCAVLGAVAARRLNEAATVMGEDVRQRFREAAQFGFVPVSEGEVDEETVLALRVQLGTSSAEAQGEDDQEEEFYGNIRGGASVISAPSDEDLPSEVDWRPYMTNVKFQGPCGVCWAFVATAMVEFRLARDLGIEPISLSEQHMLDCNRRSPNEGCNGGNHYSALRAWEIPLYAADDYPFITDNEAQSLRQAQIDDSFCEAHYTKSPVAQISNETLRVKFVEPRTDANLMAQVAKGPVGVAISGYSDVFMTYQGGVLDSALCGQEVDHAAVVVGYGTTKENVDYWLVRNSWGPAWGEDGHVRLRRNVPRSEMPLGMCGILTQANFLEADSVRCVLGSNSSACEQKQSPLFCTAEHGCREESYFRSAFSLDSTVFSGYTSNDDVRAMNIAMYSTAVVLVLCFAGFAVRNRHVFTSSGDSQVSVAGPGELACHVPGLPGGPRKSRELEMLRAKVGRVRALQDCIFTDEDLLEYLEDNDGDIEQAVRACVSENS